MHQLGPEPAERLAAKLGARGLIRLGVVLALAAACQRCRAGGIVGVSGLTILGEFWIGLKRLGIELGRCDVELAIVTELPKRDPLGAISGSVVALHHGRQPG